MSPANPPTFIAGTGACEPNSSVQLCAVRRVVASIAMVSMVAGYQGAAMADGSHQSSVGMVTPANPPGLLPELSDLDGHYLWLGPVGSVVHSQGSVDTAFGGLVAVVQVRETRVLASRGLVLGAAHQSSADLGDVWVEGLAGTRRLLPLHAGVTLGAGLQFAEFAHPVPLATASLWTFMGPMVFVRATATADSWQLGAGLALMLPARRW